MNRFGGCIKLCVLFLFAFIIFNVNSVISVRATEQQDALQENVEEQNAVNEGNTQAEAGTTVEDNESLENTDSDITEEDEIGQPDEINDADSETDKTEESDDSDQDSIDESEASSNENKTQVNSKSTVDSKVAFIEVDNYSIEGGILKAGTDIKIKLTLHNISKTVSAESVLMTMSGGGSMLYPSYGSDNQVFIGTIKPDEYIDVTVPVSVSNRFTDDSLDFTCTFDYLSENEKMSKSSTMIISSSGGRSLIVKSIDISSHAVLNGKSLLSIKYTNNSNYNIEDAELIIDGNVSADCQEIKFDTVYAGKTYNKDYNVTFTSAGNQEISVKLVYTDASGEKEESDLGTFSVTVNEESVFQSEDTIVDYVLYYGGRLAAVVLVIIALSITLKYITKKMF